MAVDKRGRSILSVGVKHRAVCEFAAREGGAELVKMTDSGGWTALHRLVYSGDEDLAAEVASCCGEEGASLLETARRDAANAVEPDGLLRVFRGWPSTVALDAGRDGALVSFGGEFCTLRSRGCISRGGKAYYELEIVSMDECPQFGFACGGFEPERGESGEGVGDDSVSWAVDGARQIKFNAGEEEDYACTWREGDVIGLACDLVRCKMHVSVNGDFSAPNGAVFDLDIGEEGGGLYAAFCGLSGQVRCNLGEGGAFKHLPPSDDDGVAYAAFAELGSG